ncbi:MAG: DUF2459 domain-containing protein [Betaproteobacteria bacterium]
MDLRHSAHRAQPPARALLRPALGAVVAVLVALLVAQAAAAGATESPEVAIYVVRHGWHTGIALPRAEVPRGALPEAAHFAQAKYIEIGWGDRDFYMSPGFNVWYAVKALFWPTASVLHLVGLERVPSEEFRDVAELRVTRAGFRALLDYVSSSFERPASEAVLPLGPGLYGTSAFYPSHEHFHLFKTCNVWIARGLRSAGLPIASAISADDIMAQAGRLSDSQRAGSAAEPGRDLRQHPHHQPGLGGLSDPALHQPAR